VQRLKAKEERKLDEGLEELLIFPRPQNVGNLPFELSATRQERLAVLF